MSFFLMAIGSVAFLAGIWVTFVGFSSGGSDIQFILGGIYFLIAVVGMLGSTLIDLLHSKNKDKDAP